METGDIRATCAKAGIELQGEEGQPYHCGQRMQVKEGIFGPDYARCLCGLVIGNLASPHINGGLVYSETWYDDNADTSWTILQRPPQGGDADAGC